MNSLYRQRKRKKRPQWKLIWSGTHVPVNGAKEQKTITRDGKFSKQRRRKSNAWICAQGTDGSTALRSTDSYIYWTHEELKKFTLIKKVCPFPSSHLSVESPPLAGPIGSVKAGFLCWQFYITINLYVFLHSQNTQLSFSWCLQTNLRTNAW